MRIPNFLKFFSKLSRRQKIAAFSAAAFLMTSWASMKVIRANEFGLRQTVGIVNSDLKKPGIHFQIPFAQLTHAYRASTQTIKFGAGSNRFIPWDMNTTDKNVLIADITINYTVKPDAEKLKLWRWEMRDWFTGRNGYWLLTDMANTSANAVLGNRTMAEAISKPVDFAQDFYANYVARLETNNIPVEIQSIEIERTRTTLWPTHSVHYVRVINPSAQPPQPVGPK